MQQHRGTMILIFGILGLVVCFPFGIAAWMMGNTDLKAMDAGLMDPEGRGISQAGKILGIVATLLTAIGLIIGFFMFAVALIFSAAAGSANSLLL